MILRGLVWAALSALAIATGFAALLAALYLGADALDALGSERRAELQIGLVVYYRVVLAKALWPQLLAAMAGFAMLRRTRLPTWAALAAGATLGHALALPLLLGRDLGALPALRMHGPLQHGLTWLLTTGAVVATAWLVGRLTGATRRAPTGPGPDAAPAASRP